MKKFITLIGVCMLCAIAKAQFNLLQGTPIGSTSVDYDSGTESSTVNTVANAFDNDKETIFAAYQRSNGWVGLDLGTKHVINRISYLPRKNYANRLLLGVFEGANNPDFSDAIPLYMIQTTPSETIYNIKTVSCSRGFRYVRYVGPNDCRCNIAEIRFYGDESEGDDSKLYQITNLPLIVVNTQEAQDITSRSNYIEGIVSVISEDGTKIHTDSLQIRGRGNASWLYPKKPYKIKLHNSARLLNMPAKDKEWTLINNYGDKTLIRNMLAFEVGRRMQMDYSPAARLVNLILNGEYKGCYQLCDQIEVEKNRINITEMDNTCTTIPEITGGYLIEVDAYASGEPIHFSSENGTPVTIKYPDSDNITQSQINYIKGRFNLMESAALSAYYLDSYLGYARTLDVDAFLRYFLTTEFDGNTDGFWSVYMTKERGSTEKFKCAAVWDADLAFENDQRTYPINDLTTYLTFSTKSSCAGNMRAFTRRVVSSQTAKVKEIWNEARNKHGMTLDGIYTFIDSLTTSIEASQQLNFTRWPILDERIQQNFQALGSYQAEVDFMKSYIKDRFDWMDNMIGYEPIPDGVTEVNQFAGNILSGDKQIVIRNFGNECAYRVVSLDGRNVAQGTTNLGDTNINVHAGVYIVKVETSNGQTKQRRILVK